MAAHARVTDEHKKYIFANAGTKTQKQISQDLGISTFSVNRNIKKTPKKDEEGNELFVVELDNPELTWIV